MSDPLVSIACITYNHVNFIKDAIEGFLIQRVTFPIEIIIHDDASTDNTAKVISEYAARFPQLIVPIYQAVNTYSKGHDPFSEYVLPRCKGKYIAVCEGDDYWTEPQKLQRQVEYLEANPECGLVHTGYLCLDQTRNVFLAADQMVINQGDAFRGLLYCNNISTPTVCFRKDLLEYVDFKSMSDQNFTARDAPLWIELSRVCKFFYFPDVTCVYRILENSARHGSFNKRFTNLYSSYRWKRYYLRKYSVSNRAFKLKVLGGVFMRFIMLVLFMAKSLVWKRS
jgi:glycosyltransferase involved in cell wall biosynthesis